MPISRAADSGESEPWTMFFWTFSPQSRPRSPRMLPGAACSVATMANTVGSVASEALHRGVADVPADPLSCRDFDPESEGLEVPDPYYGTDQDYREMIEVIMPAARGLVRHLQERVP